jgi:short subunit dehydrogenase-like uncharacterized protein
VQGATGRVGQLLCETLARQGVPFDVAGRTKERLEGCAARFSGARAFLITPGSRSSLAEALRGRKVVASCAGAFRESGEPLVAAAAEAGISYIDTAREQAFVAQVLSYDAAAFKSGACLAPSMGLEVAVADWLATRAIEKIHEGPSASDRGEMRVEHIAVCYAEAGVALLARLRDPLAGARQWVDGMLRDEEPLVHQRRFAVIDDDGSRRERVALSVPGVEPLLLPSHTGARSVRTFVTAPRGTAEGLFRSARLRAASRQIVRLARVGSFGDGRFEIIVEASRSGVCALLHARGKDRYRITAAIQAFAITEALEGRMRGSGVVAPSVAFDRDRGVRALEAVGVTFELTERSRER